MRRLLPLLCLLAVGAASATGVTNILLGASIPPAFTYNGAIVGATGGSCPTGVGFSASGPCGSVSPGNDANGHNIEQLFAQSSAVCFLTISTGTNLGQSYFTTLTIGATAYASSSAAYAFSSGSGTWTWTTTSGCVGVGTNTFHYK